MVGELINWGGALLTHAQIVTEIRRLGLSEGQILAYLLNIPLVLLQHPTCRDIRHAGFRP